MPKVEPATVVDFIAAELDRLLPAASLNAAMEDIADLAVGDPEGIDDVDPFDDTFAESDESEPLPLTIRLAISYRARWGAEIEREERILPVHGGRAELILDHMARMS
jgi:hypothetical protein